MKNSKKAFTLAEVMITLCILGVLAAVLMPVIKDLYPDKNMVMFRKSYYLIEKVVYELVNDDSLYPESEDEDKFGLNNVDSVVYMGKTYGGNPDLDTDAEDSKRKSKFCKLFAAKVNIENTEDISCKNGGLPFSPSGNYVLPSFTTTDGVAYYLPYTKSFPNLNGTYGPPPLPPAPPPNFYIDVNNSQPPNCAYNAATCPEPDIFSMHISVDGRVIPSDEKSKEYLKNNTKFRNKK